MFKRDLILLLPLLAAYFIFCSWGLMNVGPYYDELLHAVATQQMINPTIYHAEVHHVMTKAFFGHPLPIMILYYVGPLKAFALLPFFIFLPKTLLTLRIFTIICGGIFLALTYCTTKKFFSQKTAILTALLLLTDPTFIFASRYDWGPVAIQNILKLIITYFVLSIVQKNTVSRKTIMLVGILSGLMMWDKLNALWFLIPTITICCIKLIRIKKSALLAYFILGMLIALLPFLIFVYKRPFFYRESQLSFNQFEQYLQKNHNSNLLALLQNYSSNFTDKLFTLFSTLNGVAIPNHILINPIRNPGLFGYAALNIGIFILYRVIKALIKKELTYFTSVQGALTIITISILVWIAITPHANGPHHMLMLYPFIHILIASVLAALIHKRIIPILLLILLIFNISVMYQFNQETAQNKMKIFWKRTELPNIAKIATQNNTKLLALDWGITLPLGFLSDGSVHVRDLHAFYEPKCTQLNQLVTYENYVVIMYKDDQKVFPTYYTQCREILDNMRKQETENYVIYK